MDSNNLYQNQQSGTEPDNNQTGSVYQSGDTYQAGSVYQSGDAYQTGSAYQSGDAYQTGNSYQSNDVYQNDGAYQQPAYNQYDQGGGYYNGNDNNYSNGNSYNAGNYGNGNYSSGTYNNNGNYSNGTYHNGNYGGYNGGGYGNGGYQSSQLDLEEPVKMSEWLIALLLMMVPCVNIVMMFVWAFSKTEKKSKSNFFKAQLIMAGIIFALYLVIIIFIAALGISGMSYYY